MEEVGEERTRGTDDRGVEQGSGYVPSTRSLPAASAHHARRSPIARKVSCDRLADQLPAQGRRGSKYPLP